MESESGYAVENIDVQEKYRNDVVDCFNDFIPDKGSRAIVTSDGVQIRIKKRKPFTPVMYTAVFGVGRAIAVAVPWRDGVRPEWDKNNEGANR